MDIIITIALITLCVIGVILMKTGIDMQIKKEGLEHRRDLYKIWSGHYPEEKEELDVRKVCHRNNIIGSSAKTFNDLVAELKCDNLQLTAELRSAQRRIEMLEEKLKHNR